MKGSLINISWLHTARDFMGTKFWLDDEMGLSTDHVALIQQSCVREAWRRLITPKQVLRSRIPLVFGQVSFRAWALQPLVRGASPQPQHRSRGIRLVKIGPLPDWAVLPVTHHSRCPWPAGALAPAQKVNPYACAFVDVSFCHAHVAVHDVVLCL